MDSRQDINFDSHQRNDVYNIPSPETHLERKLFGKIVAIEREMEHMMQEGYQAIGQVVSDKQKSLKNAPLVASDAEDNNESLKSPKTFQTQVQEKFLSISDSKFSLKEKVQKLKVDIENTKLSISSTNLLPLTSNYFYVKLDCINLNLERFETDVTLDYDRDLYLTDRSDSSLQYKRDQSIEFLETVKWSNLNKDKDSLQNLKKLYLEIISSGKTPGGLSTTEMSADILNLIENTLMRLIRIYSVKNNNDHIYKIPNNNEFIETLYEENIDFILHHLEISSKLEYTLCEFFLEYTVEKAGNSDINPRRYIKETFLKNKFLEIKQTGFLSPLTGLVNNLFESGHFDIGESILEKVTAIWVDSKISREYNVRLMEKLHGTFKDEINAPNVVIKEKKEILNFARASNLEEFEKRLEMSEGDEKTIYAEAISDIKTSFNITLMYKNLLTQKKEAGQNYKYLLDSALNVTTETEKLWRGWRKLCPQEYELITWFTLSLQVGGYFNGGDNNQDGFGGNSRSPITPKTPSPSGAAI